MKKTPLDRMTRDKKTLKSPIAQLKNLHLSSWINEALPDSLWAVLIAGQLEQTKTISIFRAVLSNYRRNRTKLTPKMLTHTDLASLEVEHFDALFKEACSGDEAKQCLSPLLLLDNLPDGDHWKRLLGEQSQYQDGFARMAEAVARCFDHQSQNATDCRWLRLMTMMAQERLTFPSEMKDRVDELIQYPDKGDMRQVRPFIRAGEIGFRTGLMDESKAPAWCEEFWIKVWEITDCIPIDSDEARAPYDYKNVFDQAAKLYDKLKVHFIETVSTTGIDARHDGSFGLVLYVTQMLIFGLSAASGQTTISRFVLRTSLEAYITLCFLTRKDDPTVWMQYRNYGIGQSKLAYLKNVSLADLPSFLTLEFLEGLASEDMWIEFQDIKLGAWSDKNLRQMATEAGVKEIYDKYYDTLSGYVHGNWTAVRHSAFGQCLNPLHRFHRIPFPPRIMFESTVPDLVKLTNLSLDKLSHLYPPFRHRIHLEAKNPKA